MVNYRGAEMTVCDEKFLEQAYVLGTRNAERVSLYARKASQEDRQHLARAFRVLANSRRVHMKRCRLLIRGKVASTLYDMKKQFVEETTQALEQYQSLLEQSRAANDKVATNAIDQFLCVEEANSSLYERAARLSETEPPQEYWVCQICGFVKEQKPTDRCPVCGAVHDKFQLVE